MDAYNCLQWSTHSIKIGVRGPVGAQNNLLNKEWVEIFREVYNPAIATNLPKIHEVATSWGVHPNGGRGGWIWVTRGYQYVE